MALRSKRIGSYWANDGEVDLKGLMIELDCRHKILALPVVNTPGNMSFFAYRPGAPLIVNRYNIPEPAAGAAFIDGRSLGIVLVPLVAFDAFGVRLGMGVGYYDRYLGELDFGTTGGANDAGVVGLYARFLDRHLRGRETTIPTVTYFVMGANEWRTSESWPPPEAAPQRWYLHSDGAANSARGDGARFGRDRVDVFVD